jgi:hypothetical protein
MVAQREYCLADTRACDSHLEEVNSGNKVVLSEDLTQIKPCLTVYPPECGAGFEILVHY